MDSTQPYSAMERSELTALRESKNNVLQTSLREVKKLRKKFHSGSYDRAVAQQYMLSYQSQINGLIATIESIDSALRGEPSPA